MLIRKAGLFRNQYAVSGAPLAETWAGCRHQELFGWHVYSSSPLGVSYASHESRQCIVLGCILDPERPAKSDSDICRDLVNGSSDRDTFFRAAARYSGRFVILAQVSGVWLCVGDACCLRQIYHTVHLGRLLLCSSQAILQHVTGRELSMSAAKREFIDRLSYEKAQMPWFGDEGLDDRVRKLLPNHWLDLDRNTVQRFRIEVWRHRSVSENIARSAEILRGTLAALGHRYRLLMPITAGWDTRLLLAASREMSHDIDYYIFSRDKETEADVLVAQQLDEAFDLGLQVRETSALTDEFIRRYNQHHLRPRVIKKTENIQDHLLRSPSMAVNVNGNATGVIKGCYGHSSSPLSLENVRRLKGLIAGNSYCDEQLAQWYESARLASLESGVFLGDLLLWEQVIGNWGARYPNEQDLAIEEVSPANNREFYACLLAMEPGRRVGPAFAVMRDLIELMWPEVLDIAINPHKSAWKLHLKRHPWIYHQILRAQFICRRN